MEDLEATAKSAKKSLEILDQAGIEFDEVREKIEDMTRCGTVIRLSDIDNNALEQAKDFHTQGAVLMQEGATISELGRKILVETVRALYPELKNMHFRINWKKNENTVLYPVEDD
jgi:hypothetical protein